MDNQLIGILEEDSEDFDDEDIDDDDDDDEDALKNDLDDVDDIFNLERDDAMLCKSEFVLTYTIIEMEDHLSDDGNVGLDMNGDDSDRDG